MKSLLTRYMPLLGLAFIPLLGILYSLQDHVTSNVHVLATRLDELTPFVPLFSLFYMVWYPFLFAVLILIYRQMPAAYYQTLSAVCLGILTANVIFYVYPTYVPRPDLGTSWNYLVPVTYRFDQPFNGFPSIHVLTCYLMLRGSRVLSGKTRYAVGTMAWLIIVSTLLIKQHVLADVAAGIVIAETVFRLTDKWMSARWFSLRYSQVSRMRKTLRR